jgi:hypothetical protein
MAGPDPASPDPASSDAPLISNRFIFRLTAAIAVLVLLTIAISVGGRWLGQRISLAGHTESTEEFLIRIGQDNVLLPANSLRFREQRQAGPAERVDLYLAWPEMEGYRADLKNRFDDASQASSLIFLQLSQSTMSRDMSGRLQPIYSGLFDGEPETMPDGLLLHRLRADSGYGKEVILTAARAGQPDYVVRCLLPTDGNTATSGDCQRDIHSGQDLTVLYRFSSTLLKDWDHIDAAVRSFVETRLAR